MKTVIISSSLSNESKSYILSKEVEMQLIKHTIDVVFINLREYELNCTHKEKTKDQEELSEIMKNCDNIIFAMGVHCYSVNDSLKVFLDTCCGKLKQELKYKFYGVVCTAGSEKSYLSTMHLTQICQNEWKMIQLPEIIYATGKDFVENKIDNLELIQRIEEFSQRFIEIGKKLL